MTTVFFDIDTQLDFVVPAGSLYVPGAEKILPAVISLNRLAAERGYPLISTTDAHAEDDAEFESWPPHCIRGCIGQSKPAGSLLERRIVLSTAPGDHEIADAQQIILEKQELDCFSNPNLAAVIESLETERCVVYGVVTEFCVRCAVMGLLKRGMRVELVRDAIRSLNKEDERKTLAEFEAGGAHSTKVSEL